MARNNIVGKNKRKGSNKATGRDFFIWYGNIAPSNCESSKQ